MEPEQSQQPEQNTEESQAKPTAEQPQQQQEKKQSRIALLIAVLALCFIAAGAIYYLNSIEKEVVEPTITKSEKQAEAAVEIEGLEFTEDSNQRSAVMVYDFATERYYSLETTEEYTYIASYKPSGEKTYTAQQVIDLIVGQALEDGYVVHTEENEEIAKLLDEFNETRVEKGNVLCSIRVFEAGDGMRRYQDSSI